jgi:hypothetical protein
MFRKYIKISLNGDERQVVRAERGVIQDKTERNRITNELERHLPNMYFRGTSKNHPAEMPQLIEKNNGFSAVNPEPDNYEVLVDKRDDHREGGNFGKLISLSRAPSIATYFASAPTRPSDGFIYYIQFAENDKNFHRSDVSEERELAGEMEVFGVNKIRKEQIVAYGTYQTQRGLQEIYLADDLAEETQQKIICSFLTGEPTSTDEVINAKVQDLMNRREIGYDFYTAPQKNSSPAIVAKKEPSKSPISLSKSKPSIVPSSNSVARTVATSNEKPLPKTTEKNAEQHKLQSKVASPVAQRKPQSAPVARATVTSPGKTSPKKEKSSGPGLMALIGYGALATIGTGLLLTGLGSWLGAPLLTAAVLGFGAAVVGAAVGTAGGIAASKANETPLTQDEIDERARLLAQEAEEDANSIYNVDSTSRLEQAHNKASKYDPTQRSLPSGNAYSQTLAAGHQNTQPENNIVSDNKKNFRKS